MTQILPLPQPLTPSILWIPFYPQPTIRSPRLLPKTFLDPLFSFPETLRHETPDPLPPLLKRIGSSKHQPLDPPILPYHSTVSVLELWGSRAEILTVPTPTVGLLLPVWKTRILYPKLSIMQPLLGPFFLTPQGVDSPSLPLATLSLLHSFPLSPLWQSFTNLLATCDLIIIPLSLSTRPKFSAWPIVLVSFRYC